MQVNVLERGHLCALLLRHDHTLERLDSTCAVLGLFKNWDCSIGECRLSPGDTLALYTDGITESFNDVGEEFGEQRLINLVWENRHLPLAKISEIVTAAVDDWIGANEQPDDVTLVLARVR